MFRTAEKLPRATIRSGCAHNSLSTAGSAGGLVTESDTSCDGSSGSGIFYSACINVCMT